MKLSKLIEKLNEVYPESQKMDFDNVGLMVGDREKEIKTVFLALDLTHEVLEEAKASKADLIITHHPLLFYPLKSIDKGTDIGSIVFECIKEDISVYAMHTNFDSIEMNEYLSSLLNIENKEVLSLRDNCGVIGDIKETSLKEFIKNVKETFKIDECFYYGNEDVKIKKVAICGGAGSSYYMDALRMGADIYLTGDVSYSRGLEAKRVGLNILDTGHFIEKLFVYPVEKQISNFDNTIKIVLSSINPKPYKVF